MYIDVGANLLDGYKKLLPELGITDEWNKIFIEPNPECKEFLDIKEKEIPNAYFYPCAVGAVSGFGTLTTRADVQCDVAATIYSKTYLEKMLNKYGQQLTGVNEYDIPVITLDEIIDLFYADEIYLKLDCEGAEYDILEGLKNKSKIKKIYCEFHVFTDEEKLRSEKIILDYKNFGIEIIKWD